MDNEDKDIKEPQEEDEAFDDLKESFREMKQEFRDQMRDLKEEISHIKEDFPPPRRPRPPRPPRKPRGDIAIRIDDEGWDDWGKRFSDSFEHYIGGLLDSIGDTIDRTVGSIFQTPPTHRRGRKRRRKEPYFVPEEELEEFFQKGASIIGALSDQTRLRMLKELEKRPLRQSDLSEKTNTRGGNFKHHITILKDEGLVRQEGVRERYMLTFSGREALKLVEFLYSRAKKRIPIPVYSTDEEEEDEFPEEEE